MSDISQQAPPYSLYLKKTGDEESLTFKAFVTLFLRTWPYLKPQWRHLLTWIALRLSMELILLFVVLVAFDLFNNKVLVGEKLQPSQASLLVLDVSYSSDYFDTIERKSSRKARKKAAQRAEETEETKETNEAEAPKLTSEQRRVVRDRLMVLFVIGGLVYLMLTPILDYYRTWILQRVNQFLRVTMVERAEHLSLRYHSHARTGDAIYRLYQDSAMITSVIERILLDPVIAIGQVIFSFLVLCLFSPILGILFLGSIIPMLWLIVWYTPRLQIRSRRARTTNSDLISRIQEGFAAIRIIKANRAEPVLRRRFDQDSTTALDAAFYLRVENILMRMLLLFLVGLMLIATQLLTAVWTIESDPTFLAGTVALVGFAVWNLGAFQSVQSRSRAFNYYMHESGQGLEPPPGYVGGA